MAIQRVIEAVYSKPERLTEEQLIANQTAKEAGVAKPHYDPFYWDRGHEFEYTRIYGEFASGECWFTSTKVGWLDKNYDELLALVNHRIELETLTIESTTKSGKEKVRFSTKGMVDLGLDAGQDQGEGSTTESSEGPASELSGGVEAEAPSPSAPLPDTPLSDMWAYVMSEYGVGIRAPILEDLRKMLGYPVDAERVTEKQLEDVLEWRENEAQAT